MKMKTPMDLFTQDCRYISTNYNAIKTLLRGKYYGQLPNYNTVVVIKRCTTLI